MGGAGGDRHLAKVLDELQGIVDTRTRVAYVQCDKEVRAEGWLSRTSRFFQFL